MAIIYTCDRCTVSAGSRKGWSTVQIRKDNLTRNLDLCPTCDVKVRAVVDELREGKPSLSDAEIETLQRIYHTALSRDQDDWTV